MGNYEVVAKYLKTIRELRIKHDAWYEESLMGGMRRALRLTEKNKELRQLIGCWEQKSIGTENTDGIAAGIKIVKELEKDGVPRECIYLLLGYAFAGTLWEKNYKFEV